LPDSEGRARVALPARPLRHFLARAVRWSQPSPFHDRLFAHFRWRVFHSEGLLPAALPLCAAVPWPAIVVLRLPVAAVGHRLFAPLRSFAAPGRILSGGRLHDVRYRI